MVQLTLFLVLSYIFWIMILIVNKRQKDGFLFMESKGATNSKKAVKLTNDKLNEFWWDKKMLRPFYLKEQKGKFWIDEKQIHGLLQFRAFLFAVLFVASIVLTILLYVNLSTLA